MELLLHGHAGSYDSWVRWFEAQGYSHDKATFIVDTLINFGVLVKVRGNRYYPYDIWMKKGFKVGEFKTIYLYIQHKIYGHIIYKPLKKVKFTTGIKKITDYLRNIKKTIDDMKRSNHPIALETIAIYNADEELDFGDDVIDSIVNSMVNECFDEGFGFGNEWFDFGIARDIVLEKAKKDGLVEAIKRWTYNGEDWRFNDVTSEIRV